MLVFLIQEPLNCVFDTWTVLVNFKKNICHSGISVYAHGQSGNPHPPFSPSGSPPSFHPTILRCPGASDFISSHLKHVSILESHQRWINLFTPPAPKRSLMLITSDSGLSSF